ncbi:hypothetical protein FOZ60_006499 [Perkinsus olseni]|uniref:Uncharacterized protein n=1 Tax=Perkinsus olseni TaxID=32597 RepID=A0A7J6NNM8_PEROL|nr:hypothetical protein FOZ60_006499 [Perkinsus olseni]
MFVPTGLTSDEVDAAAVDEDTMSRVQVYATDALPTYSAHKWRHEELYNVQYTVPSRKAKILFLLLGPVLSYASVCARSGDSGRGSWLQSFVAKLKLLHWVAFLSGIPGVSASPVATALGMKSVQIDPQAQRVHQLEYFHRYLLVHHLTELLTAAWPLVSNTSAFKRGSSRRMISYHTNRSFSQCPAQVGWHQVSPCGCRICHYCWYAEEVPSKATCPFLRRPL